jgi:hypothetical protein
MLAQFFAGKIKIKKDPAGPLPPDLWFDLSVA